MASIQSYLANACDSRHGIRRRQMIYFVFSMEWKVNRCFYQNFFPVQFQLFVRQFVGKKVETNGSLEIQPFESFGMQQFKRKIGFERSVCCLPACDAVINETLFFALLYKKKLFLAFHCFSLESAILFEVVEEKTAKQSKIKRSKYFLQQIGNLTYKCKKYQENHATFYWM